MTFEIPESYPFKEPLISLASSKLVKADQSIIENKVRNYASTLVGSPMIMDLLIKLQEFLEIHLNKTKKICDQFTLDEQGIILLIDLTVA